MRGVCACLVLLAAASCGAGINLPDINGWTPAVGRDLVRDLGADPDPGAAGKELRTWLTRNYTVSQVAKPAWRIVLNLDKWQVIRAAHSGLAGDTWNWLLGDDAVSRDFLDNLAPQDRLPEALRILEELHQAAPAAFPKYDALAAAFALVWDDPPEPRPLAPAATETVAERFRFYVDANEKHTLEWDLARLPAEDLKFVVDAAVPLSELQWAQKHVKTHRSAFAQVFASIRYDDVRLKAEQWEWQHPPYTLAAILKCGGICVDQAYYAATAGKANGIPTLFFTGTGARGGHAWFGFLETSERWQLDCGRYAYDRYATGFALDPQTKKTITDHELEFLSQHVRQLPAYRASCLMLDAAGLFAKQDEAARARAAVEDALKTEPRNYEAWQARERLLADSGDAAGLQTHYQALLKRFSSSPDIKVETQKKLMALLDGAGRGDDAKRIAQSIVNRNAGDRSDLSLEAITRGLQAKLEAGDGDGALRDFKTAVRRFAADAGPLMKVYDEFVDQCLERHQARLASEATRYVRERVVLDQLVKNAFDATAAKVEAALATGRAAPAR